MVLSRAALVDVAFVVVHLCAYLIGLACSFIYTSADCRKLYAIYMFYKIIYAPIQLRYTLSLQIRMLIRPSLLFSDALSLEN